MARALQVVVALVAFALAGCDSPAEEQQVQGGQPPAATPVTVLMVSPGSVDVHRNYAGRVRGAREVQVRARVEGILERRLHDEGSFVAEGAPLFLIDPKPFEVAVLGVRAERDSATADVRQAERDWGRISQLFQRNAVSERDRDNSRATLELANARLSVVNARLEQARLELGYTQVSSPMAGMTSLEAEPEGSLVSRGTLLTTIVQQDPVHVRFALPEGDAALHRAALQGMTRLVAEDVPREAVLLLPDGAEYPHVGEIDFTASTVDARTGTVSARAVFPNPQGEIVPGQFVRVRVLLQKLDDVFVIPELAVGQGADGPSVFVVGEGNVAEARTISLGPVVGGGRVVLEGLRHGERIVVNGQVALRDGMEIAPEEVAPEELSGSTDGSGSAAGPTRGREAG